MPAANDCPADNEWLDFLDGRVERDQWDQLAEHLNSCTVCSARLTEIAEQSIGHKKDLEQSAKADLQFIDEPQCTNLVKNLLAKAPSQAPFFASLGETQIFKRGASSERDESEAATVIRDAPAQTDSVTTRQQHHVSPKRPITGAERLLIACLVFAIAAVCIAGYQFGIARRAEQLERQLMRASIEKLPHLLQQFEFRSATLADLLRERLKQGGSSNIDLRCRLALLAGDKSQIAPLVERLSQASPAEIKTLTTMLEKLDVSRRVEALVNDESLKDAERFRCAMALVHLDADTAKSGEFKKSFARWLTKEGETAEEWTRQLVALNFDIDGALKEILRREESTQQRSIALRAFTATTKSSSSEFAPLAFDLASEELRQFANLFQRDDQNGVASLRRSFLQAHGAYKEGAQDWTDEQKSAQASRLTKSLLVLALLGDSELYFQNLKHQPDPTIRALLIYETARAGLDRQLLWNALDQHDASDIKAAVLLAFGDPVKTEPISSDQSNALIETFTNHPSAEVHSSAEWLLQLLGFETKLTELKRAIARTEPKGERRWYVLPAGITMAVIDAGEFDMGNPDKKADVAILRHRHVIPHKFAISTTELSFAQYRQFGGSQFEDGDDSIPLNSLSLYQAMQCCNELSLATNIPAPGHCYVTNQLSRKLHPHPEMLKRSAYRLPTAGEWEFACRAGTTTTTSFGAGEELATQCAWLKKNSMLRLHPVAMLRPNPYGVFDMHGNGSEWTQTSRGLIREADGLQDAPNFKEGTDVFVCGNSFQDIKAESYYTYGMSPDSRQPHVTIRIVRTMPKNE
ncbi:MAG: sulfatase activating formylglycine-generating enzyme [Pirellulaceae bacterium]|jgi:formylglycine-generating enzyme required for sulfatase activity